MVGGASGPGTVEFTSNLLNVGSFIILELISSNTRDHIFLEKISVFIKGILANSWGGSPPMVGAIMV